MGFFLEKKCLFSGFSGVLVDKGSPLANVELHRKVEYRDKLYEDKVITDKDGRFTFESLWVRPIIDDIDQFAAHQYIKTHTIDSEILIWRGGKLDPKEHAEFGYKIKNSICDISNTLKTMNSNPASNGIVISICEITEKGI